VVTIGLHIGIGHLFGTLQVDFNRLGRLRCILLTNQHLFVLLVILRCIVVDRLPVMVARRHGLVVVESLLLAQVLLHLIVLLLLMVLVVLVRL
jgi:hypothetical protein